MHQENNRNIEKSLTNLLNTAINEYYKKSQVDWTNIPKKNCDLLNCISYGNKTENIMKIVKNYDGDIILCSKIIGNKFNAYFASVGKILSQKI